MQQQAAWLLSPYKEQEWVLWEEDRCLVQEPLTLKIMQMALLEFEMSWLFFPLQVMGHSGQLYCEATHVPAWCPVDPQQRCEDIPGLYLFNLNIYSNFNLFLFLS